MCLLLCKKEKLQSCNNVTGAVAAVANFSSRKKTPNRQDRIPRKMQDEGLSSSHGC